MATQAEIEAASSAIVNANDELSAGTAAFIAKLALEAAERVRPRRDPTNAMRSRQYRAKKRAERAAVTRNVAGDDTRNVAAERNVTRNVTRNVAGDVIGNVPHDGALLARLLQVANGNVHPAATDTGPIAALLDQGCDLELDVLPTVRDLLGDPLQPPLRRWGAPWLTAEIVRRQDERRAGARSCRPRRCLLA